MGYLRPTAIIVDGSYASEHLSGPHWAKVAHDNARAIFGKYDLGHLVSPLVLGDANDVRSFLVAWDGSKEGWDVSDNADEAREEFVAWLRGAFYDDGSSPLNWVEVQYGGDDGDVIAISDSGERTRSES
jgi:hypothetical protein